MSELTTCNFCDLRKIRKDAKARGMVARKIGSLHGGVDIFVVPKTISAKEIRTWKQSSSKLPNGCENRQKYCVAWMKEISEACCC